LVVCRFFSVFGPAQRRLIVWELYQQLTTAHETVWLEGSGQESRDYLDIQDVGNAFLRLAARLSHRRHDAGCLTVNIARGEETKILNLAQIIRDLIAPKKKIRFRGMPRPGDPVRWHADVSLLKSLLPQWRARPLALSLAECLAAWNNGLYSGPTDRRSPRRSPAHAGPSNDGVNQF
jgi:UDP-glucose 4-epimerase